MGALVLTTLLGMTSCGDDDDAGLSTLGADGSLRALLATLPADIESDNEAPMVYLADFEAAREQLGIEAPGDEAGDDEFVDYLLALTGASEEQGGVPWPEGLGRDRVYDPGVREEYATQFGISLSSVDRYAELAAPPGLVTVLSGEFSRDRIEDAVESDPTWSDRLENAEYDGTDYWSWLEDGTLNVEQVDGVHPLGEATRLALVDDWLARTRTTGDMEATLAALDGEETLADDEVLAALASGLDDGDAVAGALATNVGGYTVEGLLGDRATPEAAEQAVQQTPTLAPYQGVGMGVSFGEGGVDGALLVVALQHTEPDAAADNVDRFRDIVEEGVSVRSGQPWSERLRVESIEANGTLLVARFGIAIPAMWLTIASMPGDLVVHN
ncbi:MAG: hypothetical protein ACRD2C_26000 [Acidimicrobiales bacterium]